MPRRAGLPALAILMALGGVARAAAEPPLVALTPVGQPEVVFSAVRDKCDGDDVPDAPARAFRDADGQVVLFAMHTLNRSLRGPDLDHLRIDCRPALPSRGDPDPARYDDASWIASTWTDDGRRVAGLVHNEYQANTHEGRCRFKDYLACWWNSVVGVRSDDGGRTFERPTVPAVMAAAPFRQDVGQGRHRGFFNPSNIVRDGSGYYVLVGTTGWAGAAGQPGQEGGACLFRTETPFDPSSWRAFDGKAFSIRFADPYRSDAKPRPCVTLPPFPAPVGSVVRLRGGGPWIAVFQAEANGMTFPKPGLYAASSADLIHWSGPDLVVEGPTLYGDPCRSGGRLLAYPVLLDPGATGRNFDDVGETAFLYYADLKVDGCTVTSDRNLVRRKLLIRAVR